MMAKQVTKGLVVQFCRALLLFLLLSTNGLQAVGKFLLGVR